MTREIIEIAIPMVIFVFMIYKSLRVIIDKDVWIHWVHRTGLGAQLWGVFILATISFIFVFYLISIFKQYEILK